jgi:hypothetical protein
MALGKHRIEYEVLEGWERLPEGWSFVEVVVQAGAVKRMAPLTPHAFQKFRRRSG